MFKHKKVFLIAGLLLAVPALLVGCSDDKTAEKPGFVEKVMDSVALSVASNLEKARVARTDSVPEADTTVADSSIPAVDLAVTIEDEQSGPPAIHDMIVDGNTVHAVFDGGLLVYDLNTDEYSVTRTGQPLRALAEFGDDLYAGGDKLYRIDGPDLVPVEVSMDGTINDLYAYGPSLMVGTSEGLYARNILGTVRLLDDLDVSALAADRNGLWIGTNGDGLYCFDGEKYRKRFLNRDPDLFDYVTTVAAGPNHLYLGTTDGMYVFDGGKWETISVESGLPSGHVTDIDASDWVVYVGTTRGVVSYFNGELSRVSRLDTQIITSVRKAGHRILAGTGQNGLLVKSGPAMRAITEPWESTTDLAAVLH